MKEGREGRGREKEERGMKGEEGEGIFFLTSSPALGTLVEQVC